MRHFRLKLTPWCRRWVAVGVLRCASTRPRAKSDLMRWTLGRWLWYVRRERRWWDKTVQCEQSVGVHGVTGSSAGGNVSTAAVLASVSDGVTQYRVSVGAVQMATTPESLCYVTMVVLYYYIPRLVGRRLLPYSRHACGRQHSFHVPIACKWTGVRSQEKALTERKNLREQVTVEGNFGSDLLSHTVTHAVPSALKDFTSVFGMGTGVTPSL